MVKAISWCAALLLVACTDGKGGSLPGPAVELNTDPPPAPAPATELTIRGSGCYGTCPVYAAIIDGSGAVFFHGLAHTERTGVHFGTVPRSAVAAVVELARANGYLEGTVESFSRGVTDAETIVTSVVADGRRRFASNYANAAPEAVNAIEDAIESLIEQTVWSDGSARALPPAKADACHVFGAAVADRCADRIGRFGAAECRYWLRSAEAIVLSSGRDRAGALARCARLSTSLALTKPPPARQPEVGEMCQAVLAPVLEPCLSEMREGKIGAGSCVRLADDTERIDAAWTEHPTGAEGRPAAEDACVAMRTARGWKPPEE